MSCNAAPLETLLLTLLVECVGFGGTSINFGCVGFLKAFNTFSCMYYRPWSTQTKFTYEAWALPLIMSCSSCNIFRAWQLVDCPLLLMLGIALALRQSLKITLFIRWVFDFFCSHLCVNLVFLVLNYFAPFIVM